MIFKEDILYWFFKKTLLLLLFSTIFWVFKSFFKIEVNGLTIMFAIGFILVLIIVDYLKKIVFQSWEINQEQIVSKKGVLFQTTDYLELYRIYDYSIKKNILQQIFKVSNITIHSTDKTHGILKINNVSSKINIVDILRKRVEHVKREKRILEITNE